METRDIQCRNDALMIGEKLKNDKLYLYKYAGDIGFKEDKLTNYSTMFYITSKTGKILERGEKDKDAFYILYDQALDNRKYKNLYDLRIHHRNITSHVVKFLDDK